MSFDAVNWAVKQRGLKPAAKIVLWHLCDCHNPAFGGAFPSQEYLSEQCEIPRSTLNVYLDQLETAGLIVREQRRQPGSKRQERTKYYLPFEPDFAAKKAQFGSRKPCPETGHGADEAESRNQGEPSPENGESRVQILDSNLVKEPVNESVNLREGEREAESRKERKAIDDAFWRVVKGWPDAAGMPKEDWKRQWYALTPEERLRAEAKRDAWLAALGKRTHIPVPGTYFREKLFDDIADPAAAEQPKNMLAPAFGKLWNATRLVDLLQPPTGRIAGLSGFDRSQIDAGILTQAEVMRGKVKQMGWPSVSMMHERAAQAIGFVCPSALDPIAHGFQKVHRDSELYQAWASEHDRRGWLFFENLRPPEWLYFPAIDPDTAPLAAAVRAALDDFSTATAQFQKRGQSHDAA